MRSLDPESKKFIAWSLAQLKKDEVRQALFEELRRDFNTFLDQNPAIIYDLILYKLIRGGFEHGVPVYSEAEVKKELDDEMTDFVGWTLIDRYNKLLRKKKS